MARKTNTEYVRALREKAVARGDCYACRSRPAKPGFKTCVVCLGHKQSTRRTKKEQAMRRVPAQGNGKNGIVTVGDRVTTKDGISGTLDSLGGGSHTFATIRDDAGYTYNVDTSDVSKKEIK